MSQETVKSLLDKINLLFNVFMKEGLDKISELEKDLLKEQINKLLKELDNIESKAPVEVKDIKQVVIPPVEVKQEVVKPEVPAQVIEEIKEEPAPPVPEFTAPEVKEVHETFAKETHEEVTEVKAYSNSKPLRNLKEVIDLNKSFIFKAELFDNSQELYSDFIQELNGFQTEKDSVLYAERLADQKAWDKEGKVFELLVRAIEKRFLPLLQQ